MYRILLSRSAEKILDGLKKTDRRLFNQIMRGLDKISDDPYCAKPLYGILKGYRSYRIREYRIIFDVVKKKYLLHVEKIEHRRNVYR